MSCFSYYESEFENVEQFAEDLRVAIEVVVNKHVNLLKKEIEKEVLGSSNRSKIIPLTEKPVKKTKKDLAFTKSLTDVIKRRH